MTNAQIKAQAIAQAREIILKAPINDWDRIIELIATSLAAKDAELAVVKENCEIFCNSYADENQRLYDRAERAEAQLAETRKALGEIEQEARSLPLHTSAVTWEHVLTSKLAVVRDTARRALEAQGGENG